MRFSRLGILVLLSLTVLLGTNCSYYNQIIARKNLVDGSTAYKERKFQEAERLFRDAAARYPDGNEGQMAQLFLARTLHSEYVGNRADRSRAEAALAEYQKVVPWALKQWAEAKSAFENSPDSDDVQKKYLNALNIVDSTVGAIASLQENLGEPEKAKEWQTQVSQNAEFPEGTRARALSAQAAKFSSCANEITDSEETKKTVKKDGKDVFQFVRPASNEQFERLKECVQQGNALVDEALRIETATVKNSNNIDVKSLNDSQLRINAELLKPFESVRSYNANLLIQAMRLAEMDGRTADRDRLKGEADQAKTRFLQLGETGKAIQAELDARRAIAENVNAANAANANKN